MGIYLFPEHPMWSLVLSTLQSFKNIGVSVGGGGSVPIPISSLAVDTPIPPQVLKERPSPSGPLLHLTQPFCSSEGRRKLRAFLEQFMQL